MTDEKPKHYETKPEKPCNKETKPSPDVVAPQGGDGRDRDQPK